MDLRQSPGRNRGYDLLAGLLQKPVRLLRRTGFLQFIQFFFQLLCYDEGSDNQTGGSRPGRGSETLNWPMRFLYWVQRMMAGRYGGDQLNLGLMIAYFVLIFLARLFRLPILFLLAPLLPIWGVYRIFSRNISARCRENAVFLQSWGRVRDWFRRSLQRFENRRNRTLYRMNDKKTHRYFRCPNCKSTLRVPKGRGKIAITCPVCRTEFIKKP